MLRAWVLEIAEAGILRAGALPAEHPWMLDLRFWPADAIYATGRAEEAEAEFRRVLDARLRVLGPDHPDTLAVRRALTSMPEN